MIQETLVQELQKTFERVAEIIRANDLGSGTSQRQFNFKSANLLVKHESSAQSFAQLTAAGLLVLLRPDKEPFIGVMGRIDFRRGGATELRALLASCKSAQCRAYSTNGQHSQAVLEPALGCALIKLATIACAKGPTGSITPAAVVR